MLALALYRAQRQADALSALRRARKTLADELGVDPGRALRELEAEVLAQSPSLDGPPAPTRPAAAPTDPGARVPSQRPAQLPGRYPLSARKPAPPLAPADELVGRDRELAELREALAEAWSGQGRLVLVEGPAGIGKSRLLGEAKRMAADQGARTLGARGSQMEREFGFGAVRQLFEPALADPARRATLLSGAAASAAAVFDADADPGHQPDRRPPGSPSASRGHAVRRTKRRHRGCIQREPAAAIHHLEQALELAWECGARGMRAEIAAQLSALGAAVPSRPRS